MNRTQKKRLFQGLLAMGIVLLVLSLLLDGRVPDSLGGMLCGIGSGLLAMAGSTLLNLRHEAKHPEMARQHDIEQKTSGMWLSGTGPRPCPARSSSGAFWRRHGSPSAWMHPCGSPWLPLVSS